MLCLRSKLRQLAYASLVLALACVLPSVARGQLDAAESAGSLLPAAAGDYCSGLKATLCNEVNYPVGTVPKKCGSKVCGFTIKTVKKSPCSAEQKDLLSRVLPMCACSAQMSDALARAPSLVQPGQVDAVARFTGVDDDVFNDVGAAMECLESAGFPSMNVNQVALLISLNTELQSIKSLAGMKDYTVITMGELRVGDLQLGMGSLQACRDGSPAVGDPSSLTTVPQHCTDFVLWFDEHAADATKQLIPMVNEVQRQFLNFLTGVKANLAAVTTEVQRMVSPEPWQSVFDAAASQAAVLECDDPTSCYEGLLAGPWQQLQDIAASLTGTHPALDAAAQAMATTDAYMQQAQEAFNDVLRKSNDTAFRQLSIYRAFWTALNAAGYPSSKLTEHPKILSDILVQVAGLPLIPQLGLPTAAVRDAVKDTQGKVAAAAQEFLGRYTSALKQMASDNYAILNILNGNTPAKCPDGLTTPLPCPVNMCDAAASPVAPPDCPAGATRCITDGCNGCQATCASLSVSSSDAGNAIAVMQTWMDVVRSNPGLSKMGDSVKSGINNVADSLNYLVTEGNSPGGRSFLFQSGLLTYNEVGKASGSFPCFQGMTRLCSSMKGFKKQCVLVPRVGACLVKKTWVMPNEHVPWVALHAGINDLYYNAIDKL